MESKKVFSWLRWYPPHRDPSTFGLYGRVKVGNPGWFKVLEGCLVGWLVGRFVMGDC